jgi:hypothetical protein
MRDLLAVITSFSLLSLYLTYHLGFSAGRLHNTEGGVGVGRQEALAYRDKHDDSPFRSSMLLDLLFKVSATPASQYRNYLLLTLLFLFAIPSLIIKLYVRR